METGTKLRQLRGKKGLTQKEVADLLDIPQSTYNNWESGLHPVKSSLLPTLAEILEVNISDLFDEKIKIINKAQPKDYSSGGNGLVINVSDKAMAEKLSDSLEKLIELLGKK